MVYYAHSIENSKERDWHTLSSHLNETATLASSFAHSEEFARIFRIAGLLHDFGKYQPAFQNYLRDGGRRGSVPHASWGAGYALLIKHQEIAFAVDGHHKGLPDRAEIKSDLEPYRNSEIINNVIFSDALDAFLDDMKIDKEELRHKMPVFYSQYERELFIRYLFSSLTDADWLDTERACSPEKSSKRIKMELDHDRLFECLENEIKVKSKDGTINHLRNSVREFALSKAQEKPGFFSMNLPTGLGKTLASISWALQHARHNKLRRIFIVLPYVNIIDQTAGILKRIFGKNTILEHHSGIGEDIDFGEEINDPIYAKRLACENWDYPIIITTTVQFFESIFSNRPSKCRKFHNISESVVIFDEVQTLPKNVILPSLMMLKNIHSLMGTSFLFCTATLPAFEKRELFDGIESIIPLVDNPEDIFLQTRRVSFNVINNYEPVGLEVLLEAASHQGSSILFVFNTKKAARMMYELANQSGSWDECRHLSTSMCPIHRKDIIRGISRALSEKGSIFVSSTQLIEAGVDFDFPCVFREIAPLESIIQSAGRCNREGAMTEFGNVNIFVLDNSNMPDRQYKTAAGFTLDLIREDPDNLHKHSFYPEYYRKMMNLFIDGDANGINQARVNFDFRTVSNAYRIIDDSTQGIYVCSYNEKSEELKRYLDGKIHLSRDDYRAMQPYMVQVYESFMIRNSDLIEVTKHGVPVWHGGYDTGYGIAVEALHSDDFIV